MKVSVKLLGILGDLPVKAGRNPIEYVLPAGATAGDLLVKLADSFGEPFAKGDQGNRASGGFPSGVHLFLNGEFVPERSQPLADPDAAETHVQVVIMKPITGG